MAVETKIYVVENKSGLRNKKTQRGIGANTDFPVRTRGPGLTVYVN